MSACISPAGRLVVGGCDLVELATRFGTPLYLLDVATVQDRCRAYQAALARHLRAGAEVHYAAKALLTTAVAQLVQREGLGLDVVSGGELAVALRAGMPAGHIHLHGNAKPRAELEQALEAGVGAIVVDTLDELEALAGLSACLARPQPVMLRLAPDIAVETHAHIQTGLAGGKFGLPLDALDVAAARVQAAPGLVLHGLHCHLGSQIFDLAPFARAVAVLLACAARLRDQLGMQVAVISPGGGLGVAYHTGQVAPDIDAYAATLGRALVEGCAAHRLPAPRLVIEPGRSIVAQAGVALYQVLAGKRPPAGPRWVHVDGGMGDNLRPALYAARYTALLANRAAEEPDAQVAVAGRYCESGDVLLPQAALPDPVPGDLLAVATSGAYTLSMASTYNLVPRPPLVLLHDGQARLAVRRETYDDLLNRERA